MPPLILQLATASDLPSIAALQYASFHPHDTMHTLIYPSPVVPTAKTISTTVSRLQQAWNEAPVTWLKIVDSSTEEIVAVAKWIIYEKEGPVWPEEGKVEVGWINEGVESDWVRPGGGTWQEDQEYVTWVMEQWHAKRRERMVGPLICEFLISKSLKLSFRILPLVPLPCKVLQTKKGRELKGK